MYQIKCDNSVEEPKRETAKELIEDMGAILDQLNNQVRMISDAIYRGGNCNQGNVETNEPKGMPPLIFIIQEQRDVAREVLKEVVKIREALW